MAARDLRGAAESGTLELVGETIRYARDGVEVWSLPVASVVLVGERTTDHGPGVDDYFFVFVGGDPLVTVEAPMYAGPDILLALSPLLRCDLAPALANRADFASRVIWPVELAGEPLHDYRPLPRTGVLGRLLDRVVPRISWGYAPSVESYLARATARRSPSCCAPG